MLSVGLDIGLKWHYVVVMDQDGHIQQQQRLPNDPLVLQRFFETLAGPCQVVLEATGNWVAVYERVEPYVSEVVLAHPLKVRAIASARIKTDKIDATTLAHLLRANLIPRAYIPPRAVREWREVVRHRAFLVRLQTRVKNRIHILLAKRGVTPPGHSDLFGVAGWQWLTTLALAEPYAAMRTHYLAVLEQLRRQIHAVERTIDQTVAATPEATLLETIPGVGRYLALLILAEIGAIQRFPDPKHLVSYAGLCPSTYASGQTLRHGHLTHQGSPWLRWALVEAACHVWQVPQSRLCGLYHRLCRRRDVKTARIAVARKLCTVIFAMLSKTEPYRDGPVSSPDPRRGLDPACR
jgi:Transposase and inactivated derivatives